MVLVLYNSQLCSTESFDFPRPILTMVDIPMDILLYIVQFIPETSLQNMLEVNSVFFNIAMDNRYKEVSITDLSPQTRKILARLMLVHVSS